MKIGSVPDPPQTGSRQEISERLSQLISEIEDVASAEIGAAALQARLWLSERLNQIMRRLRQCRSTDEIAVWLVDSSEAFCGQAALFEVVASGVRGVRARGFPAEAESFDALEASLAEAPALSHAIEENDPVVALGSEAELSPRIARALALDPAAKVYLYPIAVEDKAVGVLCVTAGGHTAVDSASLELLTNAAAGAARILSSQPAPVVHRAPEAPLVRIEGVELQPQFRRKALQARARWFARSQVARMRVFHSSALRRGRSERDIYSALRPQIEAARQAYYQDYLAVFPPIDDYLHRELVSLANDDANLLGPEYPGSLV
jgi:hypothetical protein